MAAPGRKRGRARAGDTAVRGPIGARRGGGEGGEGGGGGGVEVVEAVRERGGLDRVGDTSASS